MEILLPFIALAIGVLLGWRLREVHAERTLREFMNEVKEKDGRKTIKVKIERQSNCLYVYNFDDGTFMAQGVDMKELETNLIQRFPNTKFIMFEENLEELGISHESI